MNDDLMSLYAYDRWANERILEACRKLSAEQYAAEPVPGWSSVRASLAHIAIVTDGWLLGIAGDSGGTLPSEADLPTVDDSARLLAQAYSRFDALYPTLSAEALATPMTFRRGTRVAVLPPWVVLRHIVNHSTYHRGQLAAKLKRHEIDAPPTDLVMWASAQIAPPT
jgi:uncharacterized damage-inducible protein DinB